VAIPAPVIDNKDMVASVTALDEDLATVTALVSTPDSDSYVEVVVGGTQVSVGDGAKDKFCYFSNDGGTTAKAITDIASGDTLRWMGSIAGYQLTAAMRIDFNHIA
jgi:hypothetical protein